MHPKKKKLSRRSFYSFLKVFFPLTQEVSVRFSGFLALLFTGICTGTDQTAGAGTGGIRTASVVLRSRSVGIMQLPESPTSFQSQQAKQSGFCVILLNSDKQNMQMSKDVTLCLLSIFF